MPIPLPTHGGVGERGEVSYLHVHDAAGLRGCEPEDFQSKKRETSDAHQSLTMGPPTLRRGVEKFCPFI